VTDVHKMSVIIGRIGGPPRFQINTSSVVSVALHLQLANTESQSVSRLQ